MKIEAFTIKSFRSIESLEVRPLNPINVFFGKNNVGKSNILRGLHLAFYCLRNDNIFLPDTTFYNRDIYRIIEITIELVLEKDFCNTEKLNEAIREGIENITSILINMEKIFEDYRGEIEQLLEKMNSFVPLEKLHLITSFYFARDVSDVGILIKDPESSYEFNYGELRNLYRDLERNLRINMEKERERVAEYLLSQLRRFDIDLGEIIRIPLGYFSRTDELMNLRNRVDRYIDDPETRKSALYIIEDSIKKLVKIESYLEPFSNTFNIIREYFNKISENFILIPNREYFPKGPIVDEEKRIDIFNMKEFEDRLLSLIESPDKEERKLIQQFNSIFDKSFADLGELEIRKFRKKVFAIFDTGYTALPIENQGLGVQDLYLYLANMILFDSAIVAIEEPEGGLSIKNQKILHNIMEEVYSESNKQIFISSHSEIFETENSYVVEISRRGTNKISRMEKGKEYKKRTEELFRFAGKYTASIDLE